VTSYLLGGLSERAVVYNMAMMGYVVEVSADLDCVISTCSTWK
jgi:hypothetical protein